jgi:hypothetical protein
LGFYAVRSLAILHHPRTAAACIIAAVLLQLIIIVYDNDRKAVCLYLLFMAGAKSAAPAALLIASHFSCPISRLVAWARLRAQRSVRQVQSTAQVVFNGCNLPRIQQFLVLHQHQTHLQLK